MKRTPLSRKTPLKSTGSLKRTGKLAPASKKMQAQHQVQRQAYADAPDAQQEYCSACLKVGPTDHAHILTQKLWPQYRNHPMNWMRLCRVCHQIQEDNKSKFKELFPAAWAESIRRMELVDAAAFKVFQLKNPTLFNHDNLPSNGH